MAAGGAFIKRRHGFVGTANLKLVKVGFFAATTRCGAQNGSLINIIPSSFTTKHIVHLLSLHILAVIYLHVSNDRELVGARFALKPVSLTSGRNLQHI